MKSKFALLSLALTFFSASSYAQSLFDGVRLGSQPMGTGSRAAGMGGAMTAAVNDYTALDWNPAALAPIPAKEFGISLWNVGHNSNASFLGSSKSNDQANTALLSLGAAFPAPTKRGHLTFAVSYDRVQDYTASYGFSAVNPGSSFLNTRGFVSDPGGPTETFDKYIDYLNDNNQAWYLYLTNNIDSTNTKLTTPFVGGLQQSGTVTEEGSLYAFRVGGAIDVAENISVGMTVNIYSGDYNYRRVYNEADINSILPPGDTAPNGFIRAQIIDDRTSSAAGISAKFGILAKPADFVSLGFTIETPTSYGIDDVFTRTGNSEFKNAVYNTNTNKEFDGTLLGGYDVSTPLKIGGGAAFMFSGATLSGDFTYYDASQIRFTNSVVDLSDLNDDARELLGSVFAWRVGAEYIISKFGLSVRAGYGVTPSAYKNDPAEYDIKTLSGGLGILVGQSVIVELSYQRQSYRTNHIIYNDKTVEGADATAVIDSDDIARNMFSLGFGFRF